MSYYFSKILERKNFENTIEKVDSELKKEGMGILSDIDVQKTLENKIGVNLNKYRILGACNPQYAHQAIKNENKIGILLPCNIIVQEHNTGDVEVSVMNPIEAMGTVNNELLADIADDMQKKLLKVLDNL